MSSFVPCHASQSQECVQQVTVPMALEMGDTAVFQSPVIEGSEVPALLGLKTLTAKRALIDVFNRKLYLIGPGDYELKLPPGSTALSLETAESGHLMLPITEWHRQSSKLQRQRAEPGTETFNAAVADEATVDS